MNLKDYKSLYDAEYSLKDLLQSKIGYDAWPLIGHVAIDHMLRWSGESRYKRSIFKGKNHRQNIQGLLECQTNYKDVYIPHADR
jgi:hypothetical protein